jgi:16S rRNA G966 N2-methylase RsmD/DNA-directed RNA polymerase subunit RPC12/RpoP
MSEMREPYSGERPTIEAALPPVYTPYPNPSLPGFVSAFARERGLHRLSRGLPAAPAEEIIAGKNTPIYRLHSYHTKVPPQGIAPFIGRYSAEGDLVLDPFCGSGMTGVAALAQRRRAILCDLSPAATFMSLNYCCRPSPGHLREAAAGLAGHLRREAGWFYETRCRCRGAATVEYFIWSERFRCSRCRTIFLFAEEGIDGQGRARHRLVCPACGASTRKGAVRRVDFVPVAKSYLCPRCGRQYGPTTGFDRARLREIAARDRSGEIWYPTDRMMHADASIEQWGELWRRGYHRSVSHVHDFFTPRARLMLGLLWREICSSVDESLRRPLAECFLDIVRLVSRLRAPSQGRPTHTLYLPSLNKEANVLSTFTRKTAAAASIPPLSMSSPITDHLRISTQSAADLEGIPDGMIDYVFTDPPFGANLVYSELNFLEESWLGLFTDPENEIIIAPAHSKDVDWYRGMMLAALGEIHRVLAPGRMMTLVFHNSSARVWQAIQEVLKEVGFRAGAIATLDKRQHSFKQVTAPNAVGYDVVVNCRKARSPVRRRQAGTRTGDHTASQRPHRPSQPDLDEETVVRILGRLVSGPTSPGLREWDERKLFSKMVAYCIERGYRVPVDFRTFRRVLASYSTGTMEQERNEGRPAARDLDRPSRRKRRASRLQADSETAYG